MKYDLVPQLSLVALIFVLGNTVVGAADLDMSIPESPYDIRNDIMLAAADLGSSNDSVAGSVMDSETGTDTTSVMSEECVRLRADIDADLGQVLKAGCEPTLAQMSALMDNPLGNVAMLFNQYDSYKMKNGSTGDEAIHGNYMLLFQFPKKLNDNWNLISRVVLNYASTPIDVDKIASAANFGTLPGAAPYVGESLVPIKAFSGRTSALGDSYYVGLFAPSVPKTLDNGAKFLWGAGFDLGFDTADEDVLGTGKYLAGPSALVVYMGKKWKYGALVQHYEDVGGHNSDRDDVSMTNIQAIYYYSISETASIGAGPNIIADWEQDSDNRWTVPIGIGINKTFQVGKVPVRVGLEAMYSVIAPDDIVHNKWSLRLFIIPAVPSAMFGWTQ
jgi:hypothetical protein